MTCPFPGMNPWLEDPKPWRDLHNRLINALANDLASRLVPRYFILLSHADKQAGPDRESYIEKRNAYLEADLNFAEIDLLRAQAAMSHTIHKDRDDYRIFIRRKTRPYKAWLGTFGVRQPIPLIPIPLQPGDEEPIIDLGAILHSIYERVRYDLVIDLVIDYGKRSTPALDAADLSWAQEQVKQL